MYVVTVDFTLKPESVNAFRAAIQDQARNSLSLEADCLQFDVCFNPADETQVFIYEIYTNEAAFRSHIKTRHFEIFNEVASPWVETKTIRTWEKQELG